MFSPNGSHEQALTRGRVYNAKFLLLQHLSRGEHRQGSVGGAKHGISQIGTGGQGALVALAATPPRGSPASREEDRGIDGKCPDPRCTGLTLTRQLRCCVWGRNLFRGDRKRRPNLPSPWRGHVRGRGMAGDSRYVGSSMDRGGFSFESPRPGIPDKGGISSRSRDGLASRHKKSKVSWSVLQTERRPR